MDSKDVTIPIGMVIGSLIISYGMYATFGIEPPDECWIQFPEGHIDKIDASNEMFCQQTDKGTPLLWCSTDVGDNGGCHRLS